MRYTTILLLCILLSCSDRRPADSIAARCYKLKPLTKAKHAIQPGEWRESYTEIQEPLAAYLRRNPTAATAQRSTLYVLQLGVFDKKGQQILEDTKACLQAFFGIAVAELPPVPINIIPQKYTRNNAYGLQLRTSILLDSLLPALLPDSAFALIAFSTNDLYPADDWNFVFGQASLERRVGVWSLARLGDYRKNDSLFRLCRDRTMRVAVHETGHIFGIKHCVQNECCMNGSNSLYESDHQVSWLCWECLAKICYNRHMDPVFPLQALLEFHQHHTQDTVQITYYNKALQLLQQ